MAATLTVKCTACGKTFTVPDHYAGRAGKCTQCGAAMSVPAPGAAAPAPLDPAKLASDEQLSAFALQQQQAQQQQAQNAARAPGNGGGAPAPAGPAPAGPGAANKAIVLGSTLAGYKLLKKLGDAKSMVVLADSPQGSRVAVKVLPEAVVSKSPTAAKRFLREARSLFGLTHPNVVTLLDAGEELGSLYLAMEFFEGRTLREHLAERKRMAEPEAVKIARQVASGLGHLQQHKLVHRNVRPEHILVDTAGNVKIVGLGLIRSSDDDAPVTVQGLLVGLPQYMSPEGATGKGELDHRADFFSLGVTLFEMLAGEVPWTDKSQMRVLQMIRTSQVPPLRDKNPGVSPATVLVVEKLLAKDAGGRYATADVLVKDLEAIERLELVDGKPPSFAGTAAAAAGGGGSNDALVKTLIALVIGLAVLVVVMIAALVFVLAKK